MGQVLAEDLDSEATPTELDARTESLFKKGLEGFVGGNVKENGGQ